MHASFHLEVQALPRILVWDQPVSDDQLEALVPNQGFQFGRTRGRDSREPSDRNFQPATATLIIHQLRLW